MERRQAGTLDGSPGLSDTRGLMDAAPAMPSVKILGRRTPSRGGLLAAGPLLDLVIRLRRGRPFIPRGVHRFQSFEESAEWSIRMMARRKPAPPA